MSSNNRFNLTANLWYFWFGFSDYGGQFELGLVGSKLSGRYNLQGSLCVKF